MADMQLFRENGTALGQSYRFEALAIQDVWLARTDSTGTGDFANPSNPGPGIVNLDIDGSIIEAVSPSVSGDGRYVAFQTREDNDGRDRVLRLDRSTGAVEEVGLLDNGKPPNGDAVAPSLSRSGQRVAFVTPNSADNSQVRVRDLDLGRTVLASARANDPQQEARARSSQPALSGDGTTVAFTSRGSDLTADETTGEQMYVRNVEADFTGVGERGNELVSVRQDGSTAPDVQSFSPTVDEFGAYVAFQSTGALVADGTLGSYVVRRAGNAGVDPASLEFGRLPLGVTGGPLAVAVSNTGRGAIQVAPAAAPAPYKVESSDCDLLRRGESCTVTVSFRPTKGGAAPGTLSIATRQGFAVQEPVAVALSGSGLDPTEPPGPGQPPAPGVAALSVSPPRIAFAEQALASISPVQQAVVRNVGSVPLRISASGTSAEFPVSSRCGLLPAGASCSVDVRFKPNVVGERSGAVQIRGQATQAGVRDPRRRL